MDGAMNILIEQMLFLPPENLDYCDRRIGNEKNNCDCFKILNFYQGLPLCLLAPGAKNPTHTCNGKELICVTHNV